MADDVQYQGGLVQFLRDARCSECCRFDRKCIIQEEDKCCVSCDSGSSNCFFTRLTTAPKTSFEWKALLKEPGAGFQMIASSDRKQLAIEDWDGLLSGLETLADQISQELTPSSRGGSDRSDQKTLIFSKLEDYLKNNGKHLQSPARPVLSPSSRLPINDRYQLPPVLPALNGRGERVLASYPYGQRASTSTIHSNADSGYGSVNGVKRTASHLDSEELPRRPSEAGTEDRRVSTDSRINYIEAHGSSSGAGQDATNTCLVESCKSHGKRMNPSDYKKHMQRHDRPFKCSVANCTRNEGFTSKGDLERHQKAIHKIVPSNSSVRAFKCMGTNCQGKDKIWPRLDNFKSHCLRMHKDENVEDLLKKSEVRDSNTKVLAAMKSDEE